VATTEELERRISLPEDQVRSLLDQRRRLDVMQLALDNHTEKLGRIDEKLDVQGSAIGQLLDQNASTHRQLAEIVRRLGGQA
jgi:hypothetical protein